MKHKIIINKPNMCCGKFELSDLATKMLNELLKTDDHNRMSSNGEFNKQFNFKEDKIISKNIPRHNKELIKVIEILGEKANSIYSNLIVEEIDGDNYLIMIGENCNEYIITPKNIKWNEIK